MTNSVIAPKRNDMLLKFKNKHLMALDKMINEANDAGGIIDSIVLTPKEALGLLLELAKLGTKYLTDVVLYERDGVDVIRKKLLWGDDDIHDRVENIIQCWYKTEYEVKYKSIKLVVVKPIPKAPDGWTDPDAETVPTPAVPTPAGPITTGLDVPPPPPTPPLGRMLTEGVIDTCPQCNSSMKKKWFFFDGGGCIQPECENYWEKNKR